MTDAKDTLAALRALGKLPPARPLSSTGAVLTIVPRDEGLAEKDIPVEALLQKITAMRDKLRVLEQRVNASDGPGLDERRALQAEITSLYDAIAGLSALFSDDAFPASTDPPTGQS